MLSSNAELVILLVSSLFQGTLIWLLSLFFLEYVDSVGTVSGPFPRFVSLCSCSWRWHFWESRYEARTCLWLSNPWLPEPLPRTFGCQLALYLNLLFFSEEKTQTLPGWAEDTPGWADHICTAPRREVDVGFIRTVARYQFRIFTGEFQKPLQVGIKYYQRWKESSEQFATGHLFEEDFYKVVESNTWRVIAPTFAVTCYFRISLLIILKENLSIDTAHSLKWEDHF